VVLLGTGGPKPNCHSSSAGGPKPNCHSSSAAAAAVACSAAYYRLFGRHLDTGLPATYSDAHWRQVVAVLRLSQDQVSQRSSSSSSSSSVCLVHASVDVSVDQPSSDSRLAAPWTDRSTALDGPLLLLLLLLLLLVPPGAGCSRSGRSMALPLSDCSISLFTSCQLDCNHINRVCLMG
jgi:hypothetical protein